MKKKRKVCRVDTSQTLASLRRQSAAVSSLSAKTLPHLQPPVVFHSEADRCRLNHRDADSSQGAEISTPPCASPQPQFDLRQARNEVFHLGLGGMSRDDRLAARDKRLIKLGAKPAAPPALNYRQLQQQLHQQRQLQAHKRQVLRREGVPAKKLPRPRRKYQPPRDRNKVYGLTSGYGKVSSAADAA